MMRPERWDSRKEKKKLQSSLIKTCSKHERSSTTLYVFYAENVRAEIEKTGPLWVELKSQSRNILIEFVYQSY